MSDEKGDEPVATPSEGTFDVLATLKAVLKKALRYDGLARGLREAAKALDRRQALLCVLAGIQQLILANCEEVAYTRLIEALCAEHDINLIKVPDSKELGEWAGLCKIDREGNPRKVVSCSCVVVTAMEQSDELEQLNNYCRARK